MNYVRVLTGDSTTGVHSTRSSTTQTGLVASGGAKVRFCGSLGTHKEADLKQTTPHHSLSSGSSKTLRLGDCILSWCSHFKHSCLLTFATSFNTVNNLDMSSILQVFWYCSNWLVCWGELYHWWERPVLAQMSGTRILSSETLSSLQRVCRALKLRLTSRCQQSFMHTRTHLVLKCRGAVWELPTLKREWGLTSADQPAQPFHWTTPEKTEG